MAAKVQKKRILCPESLAVCFAHPCSRLHGTNGTVALKFPKAPT